MPQTPIVIVGAGLAGLLAAHAWPQAKILEARPEPEPHRALLRFRTDAVARLVGVEFRKVLVRKSVWRDGAHVAPTIADANNYSAKCHAGRLLSDRSIWNLAPAERYVAPEDLHAQLAWAAKERVCWSTAADYAALRSTGVTIVSTAPLPVALKSCGLSAPTFGAFEHSRIEVHRYRLANADVFQTVYFPDPMLNLYRASITGDELICEYIAPVEDSGRMGTALRELEWASIESAFGIQLSEATPLGVTEQRYGKIAPIDDRARKQALFDLTHEHGVFSLGRFATWRNILLDDVVDDITVVKKLIRSGAAYDVRRAGA